MKNAIGQKQNQRGDVTFLILSIIIQNSVALCLLGPAAAAMPALLGYPSAALMYKPGKIILIAKILLNTFCCKKPAKMSSGKGRGENVFVCTLFCKKHKKLFLQSWHF
jgi:hypothetical protein